jgi:hypothetical protein
MRKVQRLAVIGLVITGINSSFAQAQDPENVIVEQTEAQNFHRIKITSKLDDNLEIMYGCLKSTGRQAENISSIVNADSFFDSGAIKRSIWNFIPGGFRANIRKIDLVKDDAYCAMVVGRKRSDRGVPAYRIGREWTGNLVIMTFDEGGEKKEVLASTLFCPRIYWKKICYKTAPSGVKYQDGKFWWKGQEILDEKHVVSGVAGCFSLINKKNGTRHSLIAYLGEVPDSIKSQVKDGGEWNSLSAESCYERGFRVGD